VSGALRERADKVRSLDDALAAVTDGCLLAVGGLWFHNAPSAAVRALVRRGVRAIDLLTAPPSSFTTDLLVGAGVVGRAYLPHVSFEHLGLAPNVRRAAETGTIELVECDEATLLGGLMATLEGLPEHPILSLKGTDHLRTSPLARPGATSDGTPALVPPALRPDVALLHAQQADRHGNVRHLGTPFCDPLLAKAARHVVVTVDEIVDNNVVRAEPHRTTLPGYLVDAVVELPFGAHPCASHGRYPHDEEHLLGYLAACRGGALSAYLARWVHGPSGHEEYLAAAGGAARLHGLAEEVA
jgi:glutaconate CoA-transferase subunit A